MVSLRETLEQHLEDQRAIDRNYERLKAQAEGLAKSADPAVVAGSKSLSREVTERHAESRARIKELERQLAEVIDQEQRSTLQFERDDAAQWLRRFHTSLSIGNGAGFALVTSALLQSDHLDQAIVFAWAPLLFFGPGVVLAGLLPVLMSLQRAEDWRPMRAALKWATLSAATLSAAAFAAAITIAVIDVHRAQRVSAVIARAERQIAGAELAQRWLALSTKGAPLDPALRVEVEKTLRELGGPAARQFPAPAPVPAAPGSRSTAGSPTAPAPGAVKPSTR